MPLSAPPLLGLLVATAALHPASQLTGSTGPPADAASWVGDSHPATVTLGEVSPDVGSADAGSPGAGTPGTGRRAGKVGIAPRSPDAVWPLSPRPAVVSGFEAPLSAYGAGHRGVDLAGAPGQAVRAAAQGRVTYAGLLAGRGVVVVSHGETRTTYEPVAADVLVGDQVEPGSVLGTLQRTASHCAPATCLHWGLIRGSTYLDPLLLVHAAPVRLLPLPPGQPVVT